MNGSNIYEVKYNGDEICMIKYNGSILWENYITLIDYEVFEPDVSTIKPIIPWFGDNITLDDMIIEEEVIGSGTLEELYPGSIQLPNSGILYRRKIKAKKEPNAFRFSALTNHESHTSAGVTGNYYHLKIYDLCDLRDVVDVTAAFSDFEEKYSFNHYNFDFVSDKTFRKAQNFQSTFAQSLLADSDLAKFTGIMSEITGRVECDCMLMFYDCTNLTKITNIPWGKMLPTDMMMTFAGCTNLTTVDLSDLDLSSCTQTIQMFYGCTSLTTLRLDNCNNATINKIITSSSFPTFSSGTHRIYCKEANASGLTAPEGWTFTYVS